MKKSLSSLSVDGLRAWRALVDCGVIRTHGERCPAYVDLFDAGIADYKIVPGTEKLDWRLSKAAARPA